MSNYRREKLQLIVILVVFDFSYVLRILFYLTFLRLESTYTHSHKSLILAVSMTTDLWPTVVMLIVHQLNFK